MKRFALSALLLGLAAPLAAQDIIFSNLPAVTPGNVPSLGYQATSTSQFGDRIIFGGTSRSLQSVEVLMSNWALGSTYPTLFAANALGYTHDLTFSIFSVGAGGAVGGQLASVTQSTFVPWRPEASPGCTDGAWADQGGTCYNGLAFTTTFDFTALGVTLPDEIIFGLSYNTQSYGSTPLGVGGPYNSLNFGLVAGSPSAGTDFNADEIYWETSWIGATTYPGYDGSFGIDNGWTDYAPGVAFTAGPSDVVPEPATMTLLATGLAGMAASRRRKAKQA